MSCQGCAGTSDQHTCTGAERINLNEQTAIELGWTYDETGDDSVFHWRAPCGLVEPRPPNFRTDPLASLQLIDKMKSEDSFEMRWSHQDRWWLAMCWDEKETKGRGLGSDIPQAVWKCWLAYMGWSEED